MIKYVVDISNIMISYLSNCLQGPVDAGDNDESVRLLSREHLLIL